MFVARGSQAISIGTAAVKTRINGINLTMDRMRNPDVAYRTASHAKIINTHASQLLYYKRDLSATITTSNAEGVVGAGKDVIIPLQNKDEIQFIASGATTTGYLEIGSSD